MGRVEHPPFVITNMAACGLYNMAAVGNNEMIM